MKFLTDREIGRLINPAAAFRLAQQAFSAWGEKRVQMPPKVYLTLSKGDFRAMPALIKPSKGGGGAATTGDGSGIVGIKWISVYPDNLKKGLPAVNGTLLLSDAATGRLQAVLEANVLTALRTGAAGALATQLLAPPTASKLLLVGAGVQSAYQLTSHLVLKRWASVSIWSPDPAQSRNFITQHGSDVKKYRNTQFGAVDSLESAVRSAHVICTCTPSRRPLIENSWVAAGTHINAIGADAPGKQELEISLLRRAKVVVDDWEQASHSGEINVACSRKKFFQKNIVGDLGTVLVRKRGVRKSPEDITIFDSTGLAIQDMIMADYAVRPPAKRRSRT